MYWQNGGLCFESTGKQKQSGYDVEYTVLIKNNQLTLIQLIRPVVFFLGWISEEVVNQLAAFPDASVVQPGKTSITVKKDPSQHLYSRFVKLMVISK